MRTRLFASWLATHLLSAAPVLAATYFVDNEWGDYTNANGGLFNPYEQIQDAADVVGDGDTVYVRQRATAYEKFEMKASGTSAQSRIKFIGYAGASLIVLDDGSGVPQDYDDIDSTGYSGEPESNIADSPEIWADDRTSTTAAVEFNGHDYIEFRNFWVGNAKSGLRMANSDGCKIANVYIRNCGDPENNPGGAPDGQGIYLSEGSSDNTFENCTLYNTGNHGIRLHNDSDRNDFAFCRVFCDDDSDGGDTESDGGMSPVHYYFLVSGSDENIFLNCSAHRYPDAIDGKGLRHPGHGFTIAANAQLGEASTENEFIDCDSLNMGDAVLLRFTGTHGNTIDGFISLVLQEAWDGPPDSDDPRHERMKAVGSIRVHGGAHDNRFRGCRVTNGDTAVTFTGSTEDNNANDEESCSWFNLFENCIFECELAIWLLDLSDEGYAGTTPPNGNLSNGTKQKVSSNVFWHCTFVGDPDCSYETGTWPSGEPEEAYDDKNRFLNASRHAENNWLISCIITGFDYFSEGRQGLSLSNLDYTPVPIVGNGFTFKNCCLYNPASFWEETAPDGDSSSPFDETDLGDDNIDDDPEIGGSAYDPSSTSPCIDNGFDGDWDGDGTPGQSGDLVEAAAQGFPVGAFPSGISPWPTTVDYDLNTARPHEDGWDIGAQEEH